VKQFDDADIEVFFERVFVRGVDVPHDAFQRLRSRLVVRHDLMTQVGKSLAHDRFGPRIHAALSFTMTSCGVACGAKRISN
jgi:hypothetical protein